MWLGVVMEDIDAFLTEQVSQRTNHLRVRLEIVADNLEKNKLSETIEKVIRLFREMLA